MSNDITFCIAGKNNIAINCLLFLTSELGAHNLCFLPNADDTGVDGWQKSFLRHARLLNIQQVNISDLYSIENLIFLSTEYSNLIDVNKFSSSKLFNIHFSLLPKYKGMYTSSWPIFKGDNSSGVTLHVIDHGIDTGNIIDQIEFSINPSDNARDLYFKYIEFGFILFRNNYRKLLSGNYLSQIQKSSFASYFSKDSIDYKNIIIDFNKTAFEVNNQFRGFTFKEYQYPVFYEKYIFKSEITCQRSLVKPGSIVFCNKSFIIVSTIDYDIKLFILDSLLY